MVINNHKLSGTFALNKNEAIHRWYPYAEGFSSSFVEYELERIINLDEKITSVYDPFGGCGTTPLTASQMGIDSYYSETNPFMSYICDVKTNIARKAYENIDDVSFTLYRFIDKLNMIELKSSGNINYQGFEKYYRPDVLNEILFLQSLIDNDCQGDIENKIAKTALACVLINISNMVRRGDLRYAKNGEKTEKDFDVKEIFTEKLKAILSDIEEFGCSIKAKSTLLSEDARDIQSNNLVNCVITSPPYLNGTNYVRNTKLELKLLGFIEYEKDLPKYHSKGIIAGINSVSKRNNPDIYILDDIKEIVKELEALAYDIRIPKMIIGYFYDMNKVFNKLKNILIDGGYFILDIGDSQFAGVHIPTHDILTSLAKKEGFELSNETILRTRRSKNGMLLTQRILRFKLK